MWANLKLRITFSSFVGLELFGAHESAACPKSSNKINLHYQSIHVQVSWLQRVSEVGTRVGGLVSRNTYGFCDIALISLKILHFF